MNTMVQTFKEMGQAKLAALVGAAILVLAIFVGLAFHFSSPVMSPLYTGLAVEDSAKIVEELDKRNVKYELRGDGSQIMVPSDEVLKLRMNLAQEGIPSGGSMVGYEIFDRSEALGTSNFVQNVNMLRALEGELSRTIGSFSQVENARVHLVLPKRELFTREKQEPTASVVLKLKGSAGLSRAEVAAIQHLIASSVPELKPSRITITDSRGNLLAKGVDDPNDPQVAASTAEEFRIAYENRMRDKVESLIGNSLGQNKVKVNLAADIDFDRIVTNSETFDPEGQVARSIQSSDENEQSNEKDVKDNVSVQNNLPNASPNEAGTLSTRNMQRTDETTNYEISKTVQNHVKETGTVKKLSVAVLVDGNYSTDADGNEVYAPRSEEELKQIATLVKSAVGYDEKRGDTVEVVNMRFSAPPADSMAESPYDWLKQDLAGIIKTLIIGIIVITLAVLLIVRPLNRYFEATSGVKEGEEGQGALGGPGGLGQLTDQSGAGSLLGLPDGTGIGDEDETMMAIERIQGGVKTSAYKKINEMVERHPDETLTVLRRWMNKEAA